jgi:subfamily B ATP-binding cassette protein MsbA
LFDQARRKILISRSELADPRQQGVARRLLAESVRPHGRAIALACLCMALAAAATTANAWLMEPVLDRVFVAKDRSMLILVPLAVVIAAVIKGVSTYGQAVMMNGVGQRIIAEMQVRLFAHLMRADLKFFHDTPSGGLTARFTADVNMLRGAVEKAITGMARDTLTVVFLVALMFHQNWTLALIAFVAFPLAIVPIVRLGRRTRKLGAGTLDRMGALSALLDEAFQGARHVKAYGMENHEIGRARRAVEDVTRLVIKGARARAASHPIMETLGALAVAAVILHGGSQVIAGTTTPGTFFSFITALLLAYQPVKSLSSLNATLNEGLAAADRIFALLDREPEIKDPPRPRELAPIAREIRFARVRFCYVPGQPVLDGFDLACPVGSTTAIVGASGAGKSTLLNLIARFYDVEQGALTIDGIDVREVTLASLRRQIAIVSQEASLFHDTVRANIAYGRPSASMAEIERAATLAGASEFIAGLPQGYDTVVGERGLKLSGGQRQRLSIARALLKDAPILLLDEATSALDNETERQVLRALGGLMRGRTTLVVAHRLSTIVEADSICVIEDGRVAEQGTHAVLLARGGIYARLHALQANEAPAPAAPS